VHTAYRTESRRVLASLIRILGDFDCAENAMQDAFRDMLVQMQKSVLRAIPFEAIRLRLS
jgi:RNA polymerase sigma-70 factor, ECF subfamily